MTTTNEFAAVARGPVDYPGYLIVVEGIDGSGKTTQQRLLRRWLESQGVAVFYTEWNSSELVKKATKAGKRKATLTPVTFSLIHATDFADRHMYQIMPPLKAGMVVVADRYVYTAFSRDRARGVHPGWVRNVYAFAAQPDLAFYFRVPVELALERVLAARAKLKYYEAGLDLGLHTDVVESFRLFQSRVVEEYEKMVEEMGLIVIDATQPIAAQQAQIRQIVAERLGLAVTEDEA